MNVDMPKIMVFKNTDTTNPKHAYLACFYGSARGEAIPMNFMAETEDSAVESLTNWWTMINTKTQTANKDNNLSGRGKSNLGKVWVVSKFDRCRVNPEEVDRYIEEGYKRGKTW